MASNEIVQSPGNFLPDTSYGKYIKRSRICPICIHPEHMTINLMRARDRLTYDEIAQNMNVSLDSLDIHFKNHFYISKNSRTLIELKEGENTTEANELIAKIMEGDVDLFSGAVAVLDSKVERLHPIRERIKSLTDHLETSNLDQFETQEFVQLNKLAEEIENSIFKMYQIIDKKLFPFRKEDLANAVIAYKHNILSKIVDYVQIRLIELESIPSYTTTNIELIGELRQILAQDFNKLEEDILKSGGIMQPPVEILNNGGDGTNDS